MKHFFFLLKTTIWLLAMFVSGLVTANPRPRNQIRFPADCGYFAHRGGIETRADYCAKTLSGAVDRLRASPIAAHCNDLLKSGSPLDDGLGSRVEFISIDPTTPGKFLLKIRCSSSAYNETDFFLIYDELKKTDDAKKVAPGRPKLLLFPTLAKLQPPSATMDWGLKPFESYIFFREYDAQTGKFYEFRKGTGSGSTGYYVEYKLDAAFRPTLDFVVVKTVDDQKSPYSYRKTDPPTGLGWVRFSPKVKPKGCVVDIGRENCP